MAVQQTIPVIEDIFHLTYVQNRGAAFSLLEGVSWVLILFPACMLLGGILFLMIKGKTVSPMCKVALTFIISGGIGNLIDRIKLGYVVDYLDFRSFPVFNLADIFICLGCFLLALYILFFEGKKQEQSDGAGTDL